MAQKVEFVIDAIRRAPRPFILYVTRPDEAAQWLELLLAKGFERVRHFTGETPAGERQRLLEDWKRDRLDGMVATSAFGLGVDKGDVRTIVHATLPESLDRFYQEVGRSGRDGMASASLLLFTESDVEQARGMAGARLIGNDIGYDRWTAMVDNPLHLASAPGDIWLDLDRLRPDLNTHGKTNRMWNLRTLNLMASAGLIEITGLRSMKDTAAQAAESDEEFSESQAVSASVSIREPGHRVRQVFDMHMDRARSQSLAAWEWGLRLMIAVSDREQSMEAALSHLYRLALPNAWGPVTSNCGGCFAHWQVRPLQSSAPRPFVGRTSHFVRRESLSTVLRSIPRALPKKPIRSIGTTNLLQPNRA
jgi:hypothetical protein